MANSPQAIKRARQNRKRALHKASQRSELRTVIKKIRALIDAKDKAKAADAFKPSQAALDNACSKGLIHKNKASRLKSRLAAQIKAL